jgi:hypothetical protein
MVNRYQFYVIKLIANININININTSTNTNDMQLRNGKQVLVLGTKINPEPESVVPLFVDTVRNMIDQCNNIIVFLDRIQNVLKVFVLINQQPVETLTGIQDDYKLLSIIYKKTVEFTRVIIECSYIKIHTDDEKIVIIRLLYEMYKTRQTLASILWNARMDENVRKLLDDGDGHAELLYRCLKHIVSDESESCDYKIYSYGDMYYTDVELYDWYLLPNYDRVAGTDSYVRNADVCFCDAIRRFNVRLWN